MLDAENAQGRVRLVGIRANMEDRALRLTEIGEVDVDRDHAAQHGMIRVRRRIAHGAVGSSPARRCARPIIAVEKAFRSIEKRTLASLGSLTAPELVPAKALRFGFKPQLAVRVCSDGAGRSGDLAGILPARVIAFDEGLAYIALIPSILTFSQ
nr:hypothetical protein [Brevundimonas naejangsanensis]